MTRPQQKTCEKKWWQSFADETTARAGLYFPEVFCDVSFKDAKEQIAAYHFNIKKFSADVAFCEDLKSRIPELERLAAGRWCEACFHFQNGACTQKNVGKTYNFKMVNGKVVFCFVFAERENEAACRVLLKRALASVNRDKSPDIFDDAADIEDAPDETDNLITTLEN